VGDPKEKLVEIISSQESYETLIAWLDWHIRQSLLTITVLPTSMVERIGSALQGSQNYSLLMKLKVELQELYRKQQQETYGTSPKPSGPMGQP
jgi:hypothetical protein